MKVPLYEYWQRVKVAKTKQMGKHPGPPELETVTQR